MTFQKVLKDKKAKGEGKKRKGSFLEEEIHSISMIKVLLQESTPSPQPQEMNGLGGGLTIISLTSKIGPLLLKDDSVLVVPPRQSLFPLLKWDLLSQPHETS